MPEEGDFRMHGIFIRNLMFLIKLINTSFIFLCYTASIRKGFFSNYFV